jgi:glucan 1,3-beta-glucosidase
MVYSSAAFTALLKTLQLTQGLFKPVPGATVNNSTLDEPASTPIAIVSASLPVGHTLLDGRSPQDSPCYVEPYTTPLTTETVAPFDQDMATIMRYRQQQSVNLGSWYVGTYPTPAGYTDTKNFRFVHENWMTPSLFECASGNKVSELDIASGWGSVDAARWTLERHWDTFITRSDFQYLASIGINTVRLPVGYWNLGPSYCQDTPFHDFSDVYQNSWSKVIHVINMAAEFGIGVLVDLHGAVGSQNGQPHSGISDGATNLFKNPSNVKKTLDVLIYLVQQMVSMTNVVGIQVLNEPENVSELTDFCKSGFLLINFSICSCH